MPVVSEATNALGRSTSERSMETSAVIRWFLDAELNTCNLQLRSHDNVEPQSLSTAVAVICRNSQQLDVRSMAYVLTLLFFRR